MSIKISQSPQKQSHHNLTAVFFSILVHVIVVNLLIMGSFWTQPKPIEAELWDAASLASATIQDATVEVEDTADESENNQVVKTPIDQVNPIEQPADIHTKKSDERKAVITPKLTQPKPEFKKPEPSVTVKSKTEPNKKKVESKEENKARASILGAVTKGSGNKSGASSSGSGSEDVAGYKSAVKRRIEVDAKGLSGKSAVVLINVSASGQVLGKRILRSSGDSAWDQRLLASISRLPPNAPTAVQNNNLTITIKP